INMMGVGDYWHASLNPLELKYLPTGQKMIFRGLDDPDKIAGIDVEIGVLCWVWFEETFEIMDEDMFDKVIWSIRGDMPDGLWIQFTCTFNPWSEHHWLKARFFDNPHEDVLAETKTFRDNEFIKSNWPRYMALYESNPRKARVVCDGDWGISEGLVYDDWEVQDFDWREIAKDPHIKHSFGLDFGYSISYNAFVAILVDVERRKMWVYDELYMKGVGNIDIAKKIINAGYGKEEIWADAAEPKSIYELSTGFIEEVVDEVTGETTNVRWQLPAIRPALKGPDSLHNGIQRLQSFHVYVHSRCTNFIMEISNYCYDQDKDGQYIDKPIKDFDHLMDAWRYASTKFFIKGRGHVFEAKGGALPPVAHKSKRVISSL
ncbi:MAG: PBSX family phage terminase large subunit, partial [Candidatus Methanomethylophilus sp.]|nr:PBSX family phage terminase large subunit [Methanomethylophilus sp.]